MRRFTLLVNPLAGAGRALARWPEIPRRLSAAGDLAVHTPSTITALAAAAREAAAATRTIVVAGGDGTFGQVVHALAGMAEPATLGLLPVGSGNDLVRALGLPLDPLAAADRVLRGTPRALDVVAVNGRSFNTVGGFGLVARAAALVSNVGGPGTLARPLVRALGGTAYLLSAAGHILLSPRLGRRARVRGEAPGIGAWSLDGTWDVLLIANQATLGSGLRLPVPSRNDDGVCEVCLVPSDTRFSLVRKLGSLRSGTPLPDEAFMVRPASRAVIEWDEPTPFSADGDYISEDTRFAVEVRARAVWVLI